MFLSTNFCADSDDYMRDITFDALGMGETSDSGELSDIMESIMKLIFDFKVLEATSYDFYSGLGLIEE